ncbi:beta-lysine acetyltransferase [Alteribacillus persepolensis]|uniref:Beta-lysine acetyltransferase n=1 Tax=Alteribacillus persepolensis TaxID=568899 RepID=A0A1G8ESA7_9BACI|nr:putative beta-lysine N-acetyltransferase [Alteribacillus persepolensis]SDH72727.1 beta-lysine acetyltransferase [Alteribacillus persepolensis]
MNSITNRFPELFHNDMQIEPFNERIKIYALPKEEAMPVFLESLKKLARRNHCSKLILYVKRKDRTRKSLSPFQLEGAIKGFFQGEDAFIYSLFLQSARSQTVHHDREKRVIQQAFTHKKAVQRSILPVSYTMRRALEKDAPAMSQLYRTAFQKHPTPTQDPAFIQNAMNKNVYFTVIEYKGHIVSACSAQMMPSFQSAEINHCATLPQHRHKGLLSYQYSFFIRLMQQKKITTLFSYAPSLSLPMNSINVSHNFRYGGKMVRNRNIFGRFESMNIWFKQLRQTEQ